MIVFVAFVFAATIYAQEASQLENGVGTQAPSRWDCTDPLLAASPECSGQSQMQSIVPPYAQPLPSSSMPYGAGIPNYTSNYSDIERLNREYAANPGRQLQLPPQPLTEFQKFVASTTGQVLPIYGADLFRHVPSTFAPLNMAPVPSDYILGPGDELRIRVWGQVNFQANLRVDRSGEIFLPQIGPVPVEGLPFSALDRTLRAAIGRVYHNFNVTADVGQTRAIEVYVTGEARSPGVYTVSSLSTLVDALFASGGPSLQGSMRHIELRRRDKVITDFDLYDLIVHGDRSNDARLLPGDVIFIPPVGPRVALTGSVRNPGIYELRANESLAGVISDAGGVSPVAAESRVSIERVEDHNYRRAMEVPYDKAGLATPLDDGDIVRIRSIVPAYRQTVILRGNTANPGLFAWHPGMRLSDLIPDKESLLTRNYWWRRAQLGLSAPEFEPMPDLATMRQPAENVPTSIRPALQAAANAAYRQNQPDYEQSQPGYEQNQPGYEQSQPGYEQNQNLIPRQSAGGSSLASAQSSLIAPSAPPAQRTEIHILAPEIDWNYAAIERLDPQTLKEVIIPFELGKLVLQDDASQDLPLQPGDVVTIFSDADIQVPLAQQTKLVTLEGEFVRAGVYTVKPGETLAHLVERAGGFTPDAYLYGSEFTRESTRAIQQARINEYVQNLAMTIQRGELAMASSSTASAQNLGTENAAQSSESQLLANLRQMRATGRIVLRFAPHATGVNSLPDMTLENGDRFIVPPVPATVNVVGAVYDQNSFLYKNGLRAGAYLRFAGGPTREADARHEFIIRADGEVVSRDTMLKSIWNNDFASSRIYPGDTVVVPEKTFKRSPLLGVLAWSQMFSQFALGAAALNVIQ